MRKKITPIDLDGFHYHEALDRIFVIANTVNVHISQHPVIKKHKELNKRITQVEKILVETYQLIGELEYILFENKNIGNEDTDKNSTRRSNNPRRKK